MICPVCAYKNLPYPPRDYNICPCCSTEFGNDDAIYSHRQLLGMWIAGGANWFFGRAPENWNPWMQLLNAGLGTYVPKPFFDLRLQTNASVAHSGTGNFAPDFEANRTKDIPIAFAA
jgi:hypothetical protein